MFITLGSSFSIIIVTTIFALAVEAGIQDRIVHNDASWFDWLGRKLKERSDDKKKTRTVKSNTNPTIK